MEGAVEKQKRWQLFLILAVGILTLYSILPTLFYYSKPLKKPVGEREAIEVAEAITKRVNSLEGFTTSWLKAEAKHLGLKPKSISLDSFDPKVARVEFRSAEDATRFRNTLYRAGSLIPFVPAQLMPDAPNEEDPKTVLVQRKIGVHLSPASTSNLFHYIPKHNEQGELSKEYRKLIGERAAQLAVGFAGESQAAKLLSSVSSGTTLTDSQAQEIITLSRQIVEVETTFGEKSDIAKRFFGSITRGAPEGSNLVGALQKVSKNLSGKIDQLETLKSRLREEESFLSSAQLQELEVLSNQKGSVEASLLIIERNRPLFDQSVGILTKAGVQNTLETSSEQSVQFIDLGEKNPFVSKIEIDWNKDELQLLLHSDVTEIWNQDPKSELEAIRKEKLSSLLFNTIAVVARATDESITPGVGSFTVQLNQLTNSSSLLALDLAALASMQEDVIRQLLDRSWTRESGELSAENYPIYSYDEFSKLSPQQQKLGLVIYSPLLEEKPIEGFRPGSIYLIGKGLASMAERAAKAKSIGSDGDFKDAFVDLQLLLRQNGFIGYPASSTSLPSSFADDFIFELDDYAAYILAATREDFSVKGGQRFALLEFTDVEQRLLTQNKIETRIHEDLVKWRDEYQATKVSIDPERKYDVPPPTRNVLLSNLALSTRKYFRGDERKILKWGLDLSGGKTVRIGLRDKNGATITDEADLRQATNELYQRVNRLGVSEVSIRTEGDTVVLDFPGSQGLSASELIQASAMYFHVVNEKFSPSNPTLAEATQAFLEDVWNEAVITHRTDPTSLREIAWQHLGGSKERPGEFHPLTSHAKLLYDNGLRLAGPGSPISTGRFDDTLSTVSLFRGDTSAKWQGQSNPLVIVFHNYALEGSNLTNIQTGYDPSEGNTLYFSVRSSFTNRDGERVRPREDFYAWTSQFSEEKIAGTNLESYSRGRGWRMAVVLNGSIVSAPTLNSALRDSARITGNFSQREINELAADLKAGSLSFTPYILSEENISPDLGREQRLQGILAAALGLLLVIAVMCSYYRFLGLVASIAVLFNLLIIWGVLQNLGAALSLPGIAGIILTVGMAVDANVLVFERIREEFAISGRLPSAVAAGYRKAFSAIVDSNLTTIIAAIILLNFDSGPIKGFALTLLIGIVSSMFTALFMTRTFFAAWVQNPDRKAFKMSKLFGATKFDFLKRARPAVIAALILVIGGSFFLIKERKTIFGMDFTGGYALTLEVDPDATENYRQRAAQALVAAGAAPSDFQIRELNKPNFLRIQLGTSMEQPGKPFYDLTAIELPANALFPFQQSSQIVWIVDALAEGGLSLVPASLPTLNLHWTEMSGQLSDTMRKEALVGLGLALLGILAYITFRFEFKFAASACIALAHDLLVTLGILSLLHFFFEGIQIDLQVIAALMTIVGYSLNDTIIIFDRIREETKLMRKVPYEEILNHALNSTLSRTVMTSCTTLLVLLALVFFGGASIFNFALVMSLGVVIGTFSSLFIAAPVLNALHHREERKAAEAS